MSASVHATQPHSLNFEKKSRVMEQQLILNLKLKNLSKGLEMQIPPIRIDPIFLRRVPSDEGGLVESFDIPFSRQIGPL